MLNYREIRDACQSPVWVAGKRGKRLTEGWGNGRILQKSKNFREERAMGLFDWSEEKVEKVYQEGAAAFEAENYAAALKLLTKAAERGHAGAQFHLGRMHDEGRG